MDAESKYERQIGACLCQNEVKTQTNDQSVAKGIEAMAICKLLQRQQSSSCIWKKTKCKKSSKHEV